MHDVEDEVAAVLAVDGTGWLYRLEALPIGISKRNVAHTPSPPSTALSPLLSTDG